jgi:hypothetical protein
MRRPQLLLRSMVLIKDRCAAIEIQPCHCNQVSFDLCASQQVPALRGRAHMMRLPLVPLAMGSVRCQCVPAWNTTCPTLCTQITILTRIYCRNVTNIH